MKYKGADDKKGIPITKELLKTTPFSILALLQFSLL
jgi:hypothetical protein